MSANLLDDLGLAAAALADGLTISDVITLYTAFRSGKPSLTALDKAGTLDATLAAFLRSGVALAKLLKDPAEREIAIADFDDFLGKL